MTTVPLSPFWLKHLCLRSLSAARRCSASCRELLGLRGLACCGNWGLDPGLCPYGVGGPNEWGSDPAYEVGEPQRGETVMVPPLFDFHGNLQPSAPGAHLRAASHGSLQGGCPMGTSRGNFEYTFSHGNFERVRSLLANATTASEEWQPYLVLEWKILMGTLTGFEIPSPMGTSRGSGLYWLTPRPPPRCGNQPIIGPSTRHVIP